MRRTVALLALAGLAACDSEAVAPRVEQTAPAFSTTEGGIPGRYIVTLDDAADPALVALEYGIKPQYVYESLITGFAGDISDVVLEALRLDARVVGIEQDGIVTTSTVQSPATWGLDRIDQAALPLDGSYTYNHAGSGVTAYIIDTGIRYDHVEFEGRAVSGFDAFADGRNGADCQGHGTHVAGTVGGKTWGVAKQVKLVAVRVLDCGGSGSFSGIIAGMNWVAENGTLPAVANLSIGSLLPQRSPTVDAATRNLIASGVTVVMAAGNGVPNGGVGIDACNNAPGGLPEGITVGASDRSDRKTAWSNYGDCVTFFAPGSGITSATYDSPTSTGSKSGTSMASPHVAGVAALYLEQAPRAAPATVKQALFDASSKGVVQLSLTTNNHLVHSLVAAPAAPPEETGPTPCTPKNKKKGKCR
ncbi:MAG TPA: S8 family peptidase [Longimicrobiaceae bacterium]|nr:S8 family peptidase [Longimicrobiaceae bacterium]